MHNKHICFFPASKILKFSNSLPSQTKTNVYCVPKKNGFRRTNYPTVESCDGLSIYDSLIEWRTK